MKKRVETEHVKTLFHVQVAKMNALQATQSAQMEKEELVNQRQQQVVSNGDHIRGVQQKSVQMRIVAN